MRAYETHATDYPSLLDPSLAGAATRLAELVGARPGRQILDLATGTGAVALAASDRGATVAGVDTAGAMLAVARRRLPDADLRIADAGVLPFETASFDAVTCGLSLSHFDQREESLREVLRVLKPAGWFAASTWGRGGASATQAVGSLLERYMPARAPGLDEDTWFDRERGCAVIRDAGFADVVAVTEVFTGAFADADEALAWSLAWPLRAERLARLDETARSRFLEEARQALEGRDLTWRFAFNFFTGRKP